MTRRQLARERRAFNRARRSQALREAFRDWHWPHDRYAGCRRWWASWRGTRAQHRAAMAEMGDAFE